MAAGLWVAAGVLLAGPGGAGAATGPTWSVDYTSLATPTAVSISCPSSTTCVAESPQAVLFSQDGGQAWTQHIVSSLGPGGVSCVSARWCVAAGGPDVVSTHDGGRTWTTVTVSATLPLVGVACPSIRLCVAMANESFPAETEAWTSTDGGMSWTAHPIDLGLVSVSAISCPTSRTCFATGMSGPSTALVGTVIGSSDGGSTWHTVSVPGDASFFSDITCASASRCLAAGSHEGGSYLNPSQIVSTSDGGRSWVSNLSPPGLANDTAVACTHEGICIVAGRSQQASAVIDYSTDGGTTWQPSHVVADQLSGLACSSSSTCWAVGTLNGEAATLTSNDQGRTWSVRAAIAWTQVVAVSCPTSNHCVALQPGTSIDRVPDRGETLVTDDGGRRWQGWALPVDATGLDALSCPTSTFCVSVGPPSSASTPGPSGPSLDISLDGGRRWTSSTPPAGAAFLTAVSCPSRKDCFVAGHEDGAHGFAGFVLVSKDGGPSWSEHLLPAGSGAPSGISCASPTSCVVVEGSGQIASTTDGGADWTNDPVPAGLTNLAAVACPTVSHCDAVGTGQAYTLFSAVVTTSDAGATWTVHDVLSGTDYFDGISCSGPLTCLIAANGAEPVLSTTDGSTWTAPTLPSLTAPGQPAPPDSMGMFGVSCLAGAACVAVGGGASSVSGVILLRS